jgi:hypothetical protein
MARPKFKGNANKRDGSRFLLLPWVVLDSPGYRAASHTARSLLIDIFRQYTGHNNGKLVACAKHLRPLGWKSNNTVLAAVRQLIDCGLLVEVRKGGFPNTAAWFAVTWADLDVFDGVDINPKRFARGAYLSPQAATSGKARTAKATAARRALSAARRAHGENAPPVPSNGATAAPVAPAHGGRGAKPAPSGGAVVLPLKPCPAPPDGDYLETPSPTASSAVVANTNGISPSLLAALKRVGSGEAR